MSTDAAMTASSSAAAFREETEASRFRDKREREWREEFSSSLIKESTHIRYATRTGGGVVLLVRDSWIGRGEALYTA